MKIINKIGPKTDPYGIPIAADRYCSTMSNNTCHCILHQKTTIATAFGKKIHN